MNASDAEFARYFREHYPVVLRFVARRLADEQTAAEIASDVFRVVWRAFAGRELPERAWLYATARNLLGNAYRSRARATALAERAVAAAQVTPAGIAGQPDAAAQLVADLLDALPERHREVLVLAYWDDLSGAEMAAVLGCSVNAVWVRLSRARAAAQRVLARQSSSERSGEPRNA